MAFDWSTSGIDLLLELSTADGRRAGLEHALREAVRAGRLAPGTRLPSSRTLAAELRLSRGTVAGAYDQLVAEGYLTARTGSGTTVADLPDPAAAPTRAPVAEAAPRFDLRPGSPDVAAFPATAWLRSLRRAIAHAPAATYDYGDPRGHLTLRAALSDYLSRTRGVRATPDQIVVVSGYVQALALLARVLAPGTVAMEDPCLPYHRDVVRHNGCEVVPLPVDERGARTDSVSTVASAVVLTPAHQYPTGVILDPARRHAATEWARATGGLLIEDDYDGEFRYGRQPVGALQGMAPDLVAYVGTASKSLGPALRLGWLVLPDRWLTPVLEAKRHTDHHTETIGQLALADLITGHAYDRHIRAGRGRYRRRRDLLVERLKPHTDKGFAVHGIAAGMHALVRLPAGGPAEAQVLARAQAAGLAVSGLGGHWHGRPARPGGIIVGYGTPPEGAYPAALDALAHVLRG